MKISVVIPCFNSDSFVVRAVSSIIGEANVIVIDDGSTDNSLCTLEKFSGRIVLESWPNRGACVARNRGLELVKDSYVMFLDADDYLLPGTLSGLLEVLDTTCADFAVAPIIEEDMHGKSKPRLQPGDESTAKFISDWITGKYIPPCGILWRTDFVRKIGGWNENLQKNQDGELVLRAILDNAKMAKSTIGGGVYWQHTSKDRISNTCSRAKMSDSFGVLTTTYSGLKALGHSNTETDNAFSIATYELQRLTAREGLCEIEKEICEYRNSKAWPSHVGSIPHVLASKLLGLNTKEKFSQWLRFSFKSSS